MAHTALPNSDWTEVATDITVCRIQNLGGAPVWVYYGATAPASSVLEDGFKIEASTIDVREFTADTSVFVRPDGRDVGKVYVEAS